jgi:hypothetical protein
MRRRLLVCALLAAALGGCGSTHPFSNTNSTQAGSAGGVGTAAPRTDAKTTTSSEPTACGALDEAYVGLLKSLANLRENTPQAYQAASERMKLLEGEFLTTGPPFNPGARALRTEAKDFKLIAEVAASSNGNPELVMEANPGFQADEKEFGRTAIGGEMRRYGCRPLAAPGSTPTTSTGSTATETEPTTSSQTGETTTSSSDTTTQAAGAKQCPGSVNNVNGQYTSQSGGWFTDITTSGIPCSLAVATVQAFGKARDWSLVAVHEYQLTVYQTGTICNSATAKPAGDPDNDLSEKFVCSDGPGDPVVTWFAPPGD